MNANKKINVQKLRLVLLSAFILLLLGCILAVINYNKKYPTERFPTRTIRVTVPVEQREKLFERLRLFSIEYELDYSINFYKDGDVFFIVMTGDYFRLTVTSGPETTSEILISIFDIEPSNMILQEMLQESTEKIVADINGLLLEIPGVIIIDQ